MSRRIAEIRQQQGLSQAELARRAGLTAATLNRLENGKMQLTEAYMRQIARALNVNPQDLLETAALAASEPDAEPYVSTDPNILYGSGGAMTFYRVISDCLLSAGLAKGAVIPIDTTSRALRELSTGDVALLRLQAEPESGRKSPTLLLRQFVAPHLYVTNRPAYNTVMSSNTAVRFTVVGIHKLRK